ncbi:MAG TPA: D-glucuronyl C5-epimerase family protein [Gaiellaceae bacterium]|nr:D-glucuronyl C5-epimerase family protein [Gaiellaceae bacterium]
MRVVLGVCAVVVTAAALAAGGSARKPLPGRKPHVPRQLAGQKVVLSAIARQAAKGHLTPAQASTDRAAVNRTALLIRNVAASRRAPLESQLAQAARIAPRLTGPRAVAIFGQLEANDDWFANHSPPAPQTDITDADGVVYRYFSGTGFEFHPLANFAALNAAVASNNTALTTRLANALTARGVPAAGGGTGWEYYFDYGGRAPWLSGFAQAVAAQAFAKAATLDTADATALHAEAHAAYRAIPGRLDENTRFGPWIKLYGFSSAIVLNADLQTGISLANYAKLTSDTQAAALATSFKESAARALPSFNNGFWSYYELPSDPSPQSYQEYVIQLLQSLSKSDPRFAAGATQFAGFESQPPAFKLAGAAPGAVTFWVSKPSTVHVDALGGQRSFGVSGGWHTVSWALPSRAGIFPVTIHATDWAGNNASVAALPIVRVELPPKKKPKHKPARKTTAVAAAALPPLTVGAGLDQPTEASLARQQGFADVRMTLLWPAGATSPDAGAVAALNRLPAGTNLVLALYATALPTDSAGRTELAQYAAALAQQVHDLRDLVLDPAPAAATAAAYEAALADVFDAVKLVATSVHVDGALDGTQSPKATLAAIAAAFRATGRQTQLMDELAFHPAPAAGKNLWALADLPKLIAALDTGFGTTAQPGASLPLIIDQVGVASTIPSSQLPLYASPTVGATGVDEPTQAADYVAALKAVSCRATVVSLLFDRLVDAAAPGAQTGLFYVDETPKESLQAVVQAATNAQGAARCSSSPPSTSTGAGSTPTGVTPPTGTSPGAGSTPVTKPVVPPAPAAHAKATSVAAANELVFPAHVSIATPPSVHVGCTSACLYLVTMQRAGDGTPVLARRGTIAHAGAATVHLPKSPIKAGSYRFSVWIVGQANPGPVTITRSDAVAAS